MHWFFRGTIAMITGWVVGSAAYTFIWGAIDVLGYGHLYHSEQTVKVVWFLTFPVTSLCAIIPYATLTRLTSRARARKIELETRCRRCGGILRGLTEPRCPACGEQI